jgi:hypothetical protein
MQVYAEEPNEWDSAGTGRHCSVAAASTKQKPPPVRYYQLSRSRGQQQRRAAAVAEAVVNKPLAKKKKRTRRVCGWQNSTHSEGNCEETCCGRGYSVRFFWDFFLFCYILYGLLLFVGFLDFFEKLFVVFFEIF